MSPRKQIILWCKYFIITFYNHWFIQIFRLFIKLVFGNSLLAEFSSPFPLACFLDKLSRRVGDRRLLVVLRRLWTIMLLLLCSTSIVLKWRTKINNAISGIFRIQRHGPSNIVPIIQLWLLSAPFMFEKSLYCLKIYTSDDLCWEQVLPPLKMQ